MNYQKYTKGKSFALLKHNERIYKNHSNKNIDKEKSDDNIIVIIDKKREQDSFTYLSNRLKEIEKKTKEKTSRGIRKDAITMCEWVITLPDNVPERDIRPFFYFVTEFFKDRYKAENIISANVHIDENRPHMHLDFIPITKDERLCAKDLETKISLSKINDELELYLTMTMGYRPHIRTKDKDIEYEV